MSDDQVERRTDPRQRSFLGATLEIRHTRSSTQCLLRDVTRRGGRLALSQTVPLPDRITLTIPHWGETREARLVWRRQDEVGVAFAVPRGSAVVIPLAARRDPHRARTENEVLRARIAAPEFPD